MSVGNASWKYLTLLKRAAILTNQSRPPQSVCWAWVGAPRHGGLLVLCLRAVGAVATAWERPMWVWVWVWVWVWAVRAPGAGMSGGKTHHPKCRRAACLPYASNTNFPYTCQSGHPLSTGTNCFAWPKKHHAQGSPDGADPHGEPLQRRRETLVLSQQSS
jgi:hypothetical protein